MNYGILHRWWVFFVFLMATTSHALLVKLSDMHTMAKRSDLVIHGYVGDQRVETDNLKRLVTLTDVEVIDGLHGAKTGEVITVYQVGGQKNGIVMPLVGGQRYDVGQEIFFFGLKLENAFVSYGAGQGKLDVIHEGGEDLVVEDLGDVEFVNESMGKNVVTHPMPLSFSNSDFFKEEVKLMLERR